MQHTAKLAVKKRAHIIFLCIVSGVPPCFFERFISVPHYEVYLIGGETATFGKTAPILKRVGQSELYIWCLARLAFVTNMLRNGHTGVESSISSSCADKRYVEFTTWSCSPFLASPSRRISTILLIVLYFVLIDSDVDHRHCDLVLMYG